MAYIIPHWNLSGREGEDIPVYVYTNCQELELFKDGVSLGRKQIERYGHGEWNVIYSPGRLTVKGYNNGEQVVEESVETTGRPHKLMLRLDNEIKYANGRDIAVITCYCVDEQGRFVPDASPYLTFSSNDFGEIVGTGSDVCDHTPVTSLSRRMRAGLCTVAVRVSDKAGRLKVYAECEYLPTASLEVNLI